MTKKIGDGRGMESVGGLVTLLLLLLSLLCFSSLFLFLLFGGVYHRPHVPPFKRLPFNRPPISHGHLLLSPPPPPLARLL